MLRYSDELLTTCRHTVPNREARRSPWIRDVYLPQRLLDLDRLPRLGFQDQLPARGTGGAGGALALFRVGVLQPNLAHAAPGPTVRTTRTRRMGSVQLAIGLRLPRGAASTRRYLDRGLVVLFLSLRVLFPLVREHRCLRPARRNAVAGVGCLAGDAQASDGLGNPSLLGLHRGKAGPALVASHLWTGRHCVARL